MKPWSLDSSNNVSTLIHGEYIAVIWPSTPIRPSLFYGIVMDKKTLEIERVPSGSMYSTRIECEETIERLEHGVRLIKERDPSPRAR